MIGEFLKIVKEKLIDILLNEFISMNYICLQPYTHETCFFPFRLGYYHIVCCILHERQGQCQRRLPNHQKPSGLQIKGRFPFLFKYCL